MRARRRRAVKHKFLQVSRGLAGGVQGFQREPVITFGGNVKSAEINLDSLAVGAVARGLARLAGDGQDEAGFPRRRAGARPARRAIGRGS